MGESPEKRPLVNRKVYHLIPPLYSQAERTDRNQKELGSITPPSSLPPMCSHEHVGLIYLIASAMVPVSVYSWKRTV